MEKEEALERRRWRKKQIWREGSREKAVGIGEGWLRLGGKCGIIGR